MRDCLLRLCSLIANIQSGRRPLRACCRVQNVKIWFISYNWSPRCQGPMQKSVELSIADGGGAPAWSISVWKSLGTFEFLDDVTDFQRWAQLKTHVVHHHLGCQQQHRLPVNFLETDANLSQIRFTTTLRNESARALAYMFSKALRVHRHTGVRWGNESYYVVHRPLRRVAARLRQRLSILLLLLIRRGRGCGNSTWLLRD